VFGFIAFDTVVIGLARRRSVPGNANVRPDRNIRDDEQIRGETQATRQYS
jgi:hypothetical protein